MPARAACVLLNPQAAGGRARRLAAPLRAWLELHAPGVALHQPASVAAGLALLHGLAPGMRVVLVGGDGSLQQMLPGLVSGGHSLGLVPCGSGNDTARALGLRGWPWARALALALEAPATPFDLGELLVEGVPPRPFVSSLSAGFDAAVCRRALEGPRALRGLPRYLLATLREVAGLRLHALRLQADGVLVHAGPALFAASLNTPSFGGGMPAVPSARPDDGRLDLLLAGVFGRAGALAMLPRLLAGTHLRDPRVRTLPFATLDVEAAATLPIAADGEPLAPASRFRVRVRPGALSVVRATMRT